MDNCIAGLQCDLPQVISSDNSEEYLGDKKPARDPQWQGQYLWINAGSFTIINSWLPYSTDSCDLDLSIVFHDKYRWEILKNTAGKSATSSTSSPSSSSPEAAASLGIVLIKIRLCASQEGIIPKYFLNQEVSSQKNNFRSANPTSFENGRLHHHPQQYGRNFISTINKHFPALLLSPPFVKVIYTFSEKPRLWYHKRQMGVFQTGPPILQEPCRFNWVFVDGNCIDKDNYPSKNSNFSS